MPILRFCLVAVLLLWVAVPLAAQTPPAVIAADSNEVVVRTGDVVRFEVLGQSDLSAERIVDRQGEIQLPFLGGVKVAGLSAEQIRVLITERYGRLYANPLVNVVVRVGVNVTGEVQQPNRYRVHPTSTVLDVLAEAGGLTSEARANRIELVRGEQVVVLDLSSPTGGLAAQNILVRSGDWIRVPRRRFSTEDAYWIFGALNFATSVIILVAR